jgi:hypothetical protein
VFQAWYCFFAESLGAYIKGFSNKIEANKSTLTFIIEKLHIRFLLSVGTISILRQAIKYITYDNVLFNANIYILISKWQIIFIWCHLECCFAKQSDISLMTMCYLMCIFKQWTQCVCVIFHRYALCVHDNDFIFNEN